MISVDPKIDLSVFLFQMVPLKSSINSLTYSCFEFKRVILFRSVQSALMRPTGALASATPTICTWGIHRTKTRLSLKQLSTFFNTVANGPLKDP